MELNTHGRLSAIFHKGDHFWDFLFALLHTKPLLKRGLLEKETTGSKSSLLKRDLL